MALTDYSNTVKTTIEWQKTIIPQKPPGKLRKRPESPTGPRTRPCRPGANRPISRRLPTRNPLPGRRRNRGRRPPKFRTRCPLSPATAFADTPEELAARQAAEAAAREAADRAAAESGAGSRLKAEAGRILAAYPDAPVVYMTSNGFGFFKESEARNHAATLRDKAVITVKRK